MAKTDVTGDIGAHRDAEARKLGTFKNVKDMTVARAGWGKRKPQTETDAPYKKFKGTEDQ